MQQFEEQALGASLITEVREMFRDAFARRVPSDRAKMRPSLHSTTTREASIRPAFAGPSRLILSSEGAKMRRASLMGSFVFKTAPAARIIVTKILNV